MLFKNAGNLGHTEKGKTFRAGTIMWEGIEATKSRVCSGVLNSLVWLGIRSNPN